jgi:hypothetical protein
MQAAISTKEFITLSLTIAYRIDTKKEYKHSRKGIKWMF